MGKIEKYLAKKHYRIVGYIGFLHFSTEFECHFLCHFLCLMFFLLGIQKVKTFVTFVFKLNSLLVIDLMGFSPYIRGEMHMIT